MLKTKVPEYKKILSVDKKQYSYCLDKLINVYKVMYNLSTEEFIERFYNQDIQAKLFYQIEQKTVEKLVNISTIKGLTDESLAFQKMAIGLGWTFTYTLKYLEDEIDKAMKFERKSMEKVKGMDEKWRTKATKPQFIHPILLQADEEFV